MFSLFTRWKGKIYIIYIVHVYVKHISASDCANTGTFHCDQSMTCTEMSNRCDGAPDCQDGEDEQNCEGKLSLILFV